MAKDENKESEIRGDEQEIVDQRLPVWRPQDADREYYRYETKKRIQHYTVPPQTIFRPAKPTPTIRDAEHKRVAVYARVSTKSKEQVSSIENQTKYYTEKIAKTPNWDLAEIYSDEGKSGTSKKWRPEFKRMLEDASKKKMDLIVCASVSRFARNISDLIEEVRKLRTTNPSNPVGVYFETEDLYTLDPNINERLQMQGLFAEWESGNKSRRMILSYDQRICTGQFPLSDLLGLRHTIEGGFIIEEEEAKTVKYIFLATLCGYTAEEIAEVLTDKQRPTLRGRTEWTASMVKAIMENERRWGDLEVRKRVVIDYKEKVTAKNDGLREGAYIPHYHEGIVSPEIARAAHMMRASRYKFGSVPDVYVIDSGALKGFVSISPTWSGIDNRAFQDISRQVYNEDVKDIKVLDKASVAGERMKNAFIRSKDTTQNLMDDGQVSPSEYAEDQIKYAAEDIAHDTGHAVKRQTDKAIEKGRDAFWEHRKEKRLERQEKNVEDRIRRYEERSAARNTAQTAERTSVRAKNTTIKTAEKTEHTVKQTARSSGKALL